MKITGEREREREREREQNVLNELSMSYVVLCGIVRKTIFFFRTKNKPKIVKKDKEFM